MAKIIEKFYIYILEFRPALWVKFYSKDAWPFYRSLYNYSNFVKSLMFPVVKLNFPKLSECFLPIDFIKSLMLIV